MSFPSGEGKSPGLGGHKREQRRTLLHAHVRAGLCFEERDVKLKRNGEVKGGNERTGKREDNRKVRNDREKKKTPRHEILAVARKQQDKKVTLQFLFYVVLFTQSTEMKHKMINSQQSKEYLLPSINVESKFELM